jgi:hypothetical protein
MPLSVSAKDIDLRLQFVGSPTLNLNSGTLQLVFDQNNSPGAPANPSLRRIVNVPMNRNDTADQIMQRAVVLLDQIPEFNGQFTLQQGPPPGIVASLPRVTAFRYRPIPNNPGERLINTRIIPKIRNTRPPAPPAPAPKPPTPPPARIIPLVEGSLNPLESVTSDVFISFLLDGSLYSRTYRPSSLTTEQDIYDLIINDFSSVLNLPYDEIILDTTNTSSIGFSFEDDPPPVPAPLGVFALPVFIRYARKLKKLSARKSSRQ